MKRKLAIAIMGILASMAVFSGCAGGGTEGGSEEVKKEDVDTAEKIEITYSSRGNASEIEVYQKAVDAFNESQDKIHVTFEASPGDGYSQQLITQLAGGTAADVIFVEDTVISQLIQNGTIADMRSFMATEAAYIGEDDFDSSVWGAARNEEGVYGLSVDCNPVLLYYSPSMLEGFGIEDPQKLFANGEWNWEKFDEICSKLQENGKSGLIQSGDNFKLYNWVFANGGSVWNGNEYKFDDKAKEAFEYICERLQDGRFVYGGTLPDGQGEDAMFMAEQTGFIAAGRWLTKSFYDEGIDFDYIPYPSKDGEQYSSAQVACGYLSVNAKSEHLEAAMTFATFYCGMAGQEARIEGVGTSVPSVTGLDSLITESKVPENVEHIIEARAHGWTLGDDIVKDSLYPGMLDATKSIFEDAYVNGTDVDTVVEKAEAKAAEIIAENQ